MKINSKTILSAFKVLLLALLPAFANGQKQEAILRQINQHKDDTVKVRLYRELHDIYMDLDFEKAMDYLNSMQHLSRKLAFKAGIEESIELKGLLFYNNNQADSALVYFKKSLKHKRINQSFKRKAKVLNNVGMAYQQLQKQDFALSYFNQTLEICRKHNNQDLLCVVLNNMGITLYSLGNTPKSIDYFEQAYSCMLEQENQEHLPNVVNNLASLYAISGTKKPDEILLNLLESRGNKLSNNTKGTVYLNLGSYHFNYSHDYHAAEKYFLTADSIFGKSSHRRNPEILHSLGSIQLHKKNYRQAIQYFQQVEKTYPNYVDYEMLYRDLAKSYSGLNEFDKAQGYYEKIISKKDSLSAQAVEKALIKAQQNIGFIKKEAEINELKLKSEIQETNQLRFKITIFSLLAVLVLVLAIVFLYVKKQKADQKLNAFLFRLKNEKIKQFSKKIAERNLMIQEIEAKFENFKNTQNKETLKSDIIESLQLNGDGEIFSQYFEDQHKGFYEELKKIAPTLTNNDLRMCSLSKLRLSLKETADVLNLSVDAVKSGRYRIRKKLNLSVEESLSDFLNNI